MSREHEQIRRQIRALLDQEGVTATALARMAGLAPSTLTRFLAGKADHMLSARTMGKLVAITGTILTVPAGDLPPAAPSLPPSSPPPRNEMPRDVPVLGTAMGANGEGAFELNQIGGVVDMVLRGPGIANARKVFAIYVEGDSMAPRHRPGELRYCDPARPPRIGDDVVVVLAPAEKGKAPQAFLKELVRRNGSEIVLRQFNPDRELRFPLDQVQQVIRVLTMNEVMGV